jgi:hypothetical protein
LACIYVLQTGIFYPVLTNKQSLFCTLPIEVPLNFSSKKTTTPLAAATVAQRTRLYCNPTIIQKNMKQLIPSNGRQQCVLLPTQLKQLLCKSILLLTLSFGTSNLFAQLTVTAVQSGAWNDPNTWDEGVPTSADDVIIGNFLSVEVNATGAECNTLRIGLGNETGNAQLLFTGVSSLTVAGEVTMGDIDGAVGTITMDADATLTMGSIVEADPNFSGVFETNAGTIEFTGTCTLPFNMYQFNNLKLSGGNITLGGRNLPIEGDLDIGDNATLDLGPNTANRNTIAGTFTLGANATLRIGGGGTIPANFSTHAVSGTSTVEYYGNAQTVTTLNSSQDYGNIIISAPGGELKEINGAINIVGNLTINSGVFSTSTFSANRTAAGGTLTVANGATLRIGGAGTLPANFSTHVIGATSTVEYSGALAQTVATLNSSQQYGNLSVTNEVKTLAGSITVRGTLTFGGTPNRLVIGANTLTLEGAISGSLSGTNRNFRGGSTSNIVMGGSVNRTLNMDQTTLGTTNVLNNFTLNHSGQVTTMGNNFAVNGNLTFTAGRLAISSRTLTLAGAIVNTSAGGIRGATNGTLIINSNQSNTISFDQTTDASTNAIGTLTINSSGHVVTIASSSNLHVNSMLNFTAGKLAINGNTLYIKGNITNTVTQGLRCSSTSNLVINGSVSPTLSIDQTIPGTTNVINNVTVNSNTRTITLANSLRLVGTHTPTAGVFASGGNYTIASTATSTANIAAGSTSGGYITGDVTVERYIPQNTNRAWRLLASPTNGQTIKQSWQENQSAAADGNPGYGTNITQASGSWSSNGFDFQTPSNSMLAYNQSANTLSGISSTSIGISSEPGYFIYIRGNRSITPSSSIVAGAATTLRTKGTLYLGNQSAITVPADKRGLIGNPYACAIDPRSIATSGGCIGTSYQVWDPKLLGSYNLGAYQTLTEDGGDYIITPGGGSYGSSGSVNNAIESGAAFFVQAVGSSGTITINETSKRSGSNMVFRPSTSSVSSAKLFTTLLAQNNGNFTVADGTIHFFNEIFSNDIDAYDSRKMSNFGENFAAIKSNTELTVEKRQPVTGIDTLFFKMYKMRKIAYQLQLVGKNLAIPNMLAFLEDRYSNISTAISLGDTTRYNFVVDNNAASAAQDRFYIVFKPVTVLPVTFVQVQAAAQASKIAVTWQVAGEQNIARYRVQRSADGRNFATVASVVANSAAQYGYTDAQPLSGTNFYRIASIENTGVEKYSSIVKVAIGKYAPAISISPNPVVGGQINLQWTNQPAASYTIRLSNSQGQIVFSTTLQHNGGAVAKTLQLPATAVPGVYQLETLANGAERQVQRVIIK